MNGIAKLGPGDALIVVDVQNDFLPDGALGVPEGDAVVPVLNDCMRTFSEHQLPVYATRDWHPQGHCSFKEQGGPWPPHCLAGTSGASFAPDLSLPDAAKVVSKAETREADAYSGFQGTDLEADLRGRGVRRVVVGGLATDYCVLQTVLDARRLGFDVVVLEDATRAVNAEPGDEERAVEQMREAGAQLTQSKALAA